MPVEVLHEWSKPTPDFVTETVSRYGSNPYGEPLFRVVWSETQTYRVWKRNDLGSRDEHVLLKYPGIQRWVLETWIPPDKYGNSVVWARQNRDSDIDLGPFPARGQYEHSYTLEVNGEYMPITLEVLRAICKMIEKSRDYSLKQKRDALQAEEDRKKKAKSDHVADVISDALGPFNGQIAVGGHFRTRRDGSDIKIEHTTKSLPNSLQDKRSGFKQI